MRATTPGQVLWRPTNVVTPPITYGLLTSAAPTACGIATFSLALGLALRTSGARVNLIRVLDHAEVRPASVLPIVAELVSCDSDTTDASVDAMNARDVALVQHEYGLYGGVDGEVVVEVLRRLRVPSVVILHTVLSSPTAHQREVLNDVIASADHVVVMTRSAEATLRRVNVVRETPVSVVPHGAAATRSSALRSRGPRPLFLTWGLIGPGKGIEWMIDAMAKLTDLDPLPIYVVAGRTHPKVLARHGDAYRESLVHRVAERGVTEMVVFDNTYRTLPSLHDLIQTADVVVLPYDSKDQATSGVLVDAVAAGRPVIATAFPHAVELLSGGAGLVVPQRDARALSAALRRVVTEPDLAPAMARQASRLAPSLHWHAVAHQYSLIARRLRHRVGAAS